ncbi:MAG: hypothetical protein H7288_16010 [Kineosporiaceae bacterium]|nr:hypothetical protein [Aeromicrobium sp.]
MKTLVAFLVVLSLIAVFPAPASAVTAVPNPTPVFRFYKLTDGSHFFTNSETEKAQVEKSPAIYRYEGIAFYSYPTQVTDSTPVYRFYNFRQGVHFYTNNAAEAANIRATAASTFRDEGIAYYAYSTQVANSLPVFRFYKFRQGVHFYTNNASEAANIRATASSTYRDEGTSYYLPGLLTFSGTGSSVSDSFILPTGLAVFRSAYSGPFSNFIAYLNEANTGATFDLLANEVGSNISVSSPSGVDENRYVIEVQSQGAWTITVEQPKSSVGTRTAFSGSGSQATELFSATGGGRTFTFSHVGSSNFIVYLYDSSGNIVDVVANEIGNASGSSFVGLTAGAYMMGIQADGNWTINIQ